MPIYDDQILGAKEQAATARKLRESMKSPEASMVSGWYVAPSVTQHLSELLKGYQGKKDEKAAEAKIAELLAQKQKATEDWMTSMPQNTPERQAPTFDSGTNQMLVDALKGGVPSADMPLPQQTGSQTIPAQQATPEQRLAWIMKGQSIDPSAAGFGAKYMEMEQGRESSTALAREQMAQRAADAQAARENSLLIAQGNQGMKNEMQQMRLGQMQDKQDLLQVAKQQKVDKGTETVRQTMEQMNDVYTHKGLPMGTGWTTGMKYIPTSDAKDFDAQLETLKAKSFLSGVEAMKGLGALTEMEGARVVKAIGSLDPAVGEVAFRKNMRKIARDVQTMAKANGYNVPLPEWAKEPTGNSSEGKISEAKFLGFEP